MNYFRSFIFLIFAQSLAFVSCHEGNAGKNEKSAVTDSALTDSAALDSDALVLSLTPTVECLPLYYAREAGIFRTLGLKVRLETYTSQFDCDTALLGNTAIGGATDLVRLHHYVNAGKQMSAVSSLDGQWNLLVSARLRIKKTSLLKDRMISVARFSASDYFSEKAVEAAQMEYEDVFRPQVNEYRLRSSMLNQQQLDAAILPEPYATQARLLGHRVLFRSTPANGRMGCLVFKPSVLASPDSLKMVKDILKGYNQAVEVLNKKGVTVCRKLLLQEYLIAPEIIDSLVLPKYAKAALPAQQDIAKAKEFLQEHGQWNKKEYPAYMFNGEILPE